MAFKVGDKIYIILTNTDNLKLHGIIESKDLNKVCVKTTKYCKGTGSYYGNCAWKVGSTWEVTTDHLFKDNSDQEDLIKSYFGIKNEV